VDLVVVSHKVCRRSAAAASGYATDGGFPLQMAALSELFDSTTLCVPVDGTAGDGDMALEGRALRVVPLTVPGGRGVWRKARFPLWALRSAGTLVRVVRASDAVHAPIPGDVGTMGIVVAHLFRKPLFVRHCGNWLAPRTTAERAWRGYMERAAGGRRVMMATGGGSEPPSARHPEVRWLFSSSLTRADMARTERAAPASLDGELRLVTACRLDPEKGVDTAVEALALVAAQRPARLDVFGAGADLERLRGLAVEHGVDGRVTFHGKVDHDAVLDGMLAADLFVYPTRASEGFPKVVGEALACGLPVVTTPVSVLPSLLADGGGTVVPRGDAVAVADAVLALAEPGAHRAASGAARALAGEVTLERWQEVLAERLGAAWGPLQAT
jgi:glycosyltransferase involved in cell wall biosynthesis